MVLKLSAALPQSSVISFPENHIADILTHVCRVDSSTKLFRMVDFQVKECLVYAMFIIFIREVLFTANSVDPDQTLRFAASSLGLHCLLKSLLWTVRRKWVN